MIDTQSFVCHADSFIILVASGCLAAKYVATFIAVVDRIGMQGTIHEYHLWLSHIYKLI